MTAPTRVVEGMPDAEYFAAPGFSSTAARSILPPGSPARHRWEVEHPRTSTEFNLGHAAHRLILGAGSTLQVGDFPSWQSKDARAFRAAAYEAGHTPLLPHQYASAQAIAAAVQATEAWDVIWGAGASRELSLFWDDPATGLPCKARLDVWNPTLGVAIDVKTCAAGHPDAFTRSVASYGYDQQQEHYLAGVRACGLHDAPSFLFLAVETAAPHHVYPHALDWSYAERGRALNREAAAMYAQCIRDDHWPGPPFTVHTLTPPRWVDTPPIPLDDLEAS